MNGTNETAAPNCADCIAFKFAPRLLAEKLAALKDEIGVEEAEIALLQVQMREAERGDIEY